MILHREYYRPDIDGLRGIAVLAVVMYHLFPSTFQNGFLGVDVFFVISGYVVTQALERNLCKGLLVGLLAFYSSRVKRILPALLLTIFVTTLLSCFFIPPTELESIFKTGATAVIGLSNIALLYARFDYFSPDLMLNPFLHTWSLGVEQQYYLIFPLIFLAPFVFVQSSKSRVALFLIIIVLSFGFWIYNSYTSYMTSFYHPFGRFWEFLSGSLVYLARNSSTIKYLQTDFRHCHNFAFLLLVTAFLIPVENSVAAPVINFFSVVGTVFLIQKETGNRFFLGFIKSYPIVWVGRISYSLYLWHIPLFAVARWNLDINKPLVLLCLLFVLLLVSWCSYRFVELRFRYVEVGKVRSLFLGFIAALCMLVFMLGVYVLPSSKLYFGNSSAYQDLWLPENVPLSASLEGSSRECHLEYKDKWSADLFDKCHTSDRTKEFVYLVGNSHAQHLVPMLEVVSSQTGVGYTALTISNCRLTSALQIMPEINYPFYLCKKYYDEMINYIRSNAKMGDIVLIGARSLFEKPPIGQRQSISNVYHDNVRLTNFEAYKKSINEMRAFVKDMIDIGVSVVFAGPTPVFKLSGTQCVKEWFRVVRSECWVSVNELTLTKKLYMETISDLGSAGLATYFWDPTIEICKNQKCAAVKNHKIFFRDKHHLSTVGSKSLAPSFIHFVELIRENFKKY